MYMTHDLARPKVVITPKRLWFLYLALGFIKAQVQQLTGWTRGEIDYAIRKWNLGVFSSPSFWSADQDLHELAMRIGVPADQLGSTDELRDQIQRLITRQDRAGGIDWTTIDELPWPGELEERLGAAGALRPGGSRQA